MAKKEIVLFKRLTLIYPKLSKPDTKFHDLGAYEAKGWLSEEDAQPYIAKCRDAYKKHVGKNHKAKPSKSDKGMMFYYEEDEDGENTGNVVFKIMVKNMRIKKTGDIWERQPLLTDAKLKPLHKSINIGGGTVANVKVEIDNRISTNYGSSVSLVPVVVQVLKLVKFEPTYNPSKDMTPDDDGYVDDDDHSDDPMDGMSSEDGDPGHQGEDQAPVEDY